MHTWPSRRSNPRDFQHGQWVQSQSTLWSEERSGFNLPVYVLLPILLPTPPHPHSQASSYTTCSVCSDHFFVFLLLFSLPTVSPCCPCVAKSYCPWRELTQMSFLYSLLWFHHQLSSLWQPQMVILHSEFLRHLICIYLLWQHFLLLVTVVLYLLY